MPIKLYQRYRELAEELELEQEVVRFQKASLTEQQDALKEEREKLVSDVERARENLQNRNFQIREREKRVEFVQQQADLNIRFQKQALQNAKVLEADCRS